MTDSPRLDVHTRDSAARIDGETRHVRSRHLPGDGAMWFFVLGDMIIFGLYFIAYMIFRAREADVFASSQQDLHLDIGVLNTLLLLFSSWLAARSVLAARRGDGRRTTRLLIATGACGAVFIALKSFEWWLAVKAGHTFTSDTFMSFYFALTGVHMLHVVMGLSVLAVVVYVIRTSRDVEASVVEQFTTYWHMVDLLWVIIFALLYVLR